MAKFHDAMNDFGNFVDLPDEFKSVINNAYDEDFSSYEAKVSELENQLAERDNVIAQTKSDYDNQISSLKSANYDLLRAVPKDAQVNKQDDVDADLSDHDITIADLFSKK